MIVDAHLHVWNPSVLAVPWIEPSPALNRPMLPVEFASPSVERVVFVQAGVADGLAEAEWVQGMGDAWPQLAGIVAHAPVEAARPDLEAALARLAVLPLFVGVRRVLQDEAEGFIASTPVEQGLRVLAERGIPFDACIRHHQLGELLAALEQVPELVVVLDHLGKPPVAAGAGSDAARTWRDRLRALAALPNTVVKVSGLTPEAGPGPLREQVAPFIAHALDCFGPERLMVGSDFPVSRETAHALGYDEWFALVDDLTALAGPARDALFAGTAHRVYALDAARA